MRLSVQINGEEIILEHHTCKVYRFRKTPEIDHAYFEDQDRCFYVFNYEVLLETIESHGGETITNDYPSEGDYEAYINYSTGHIDDELEEL